MCYHTSYDPCNQRGYILFQFESAVGALPDPAWPVPKQLEHAVTTIKSNVKIILDSKAELAILRKVSFEIITSTLHISV